MTLHRYLTLLIWLCVAPLLLLAAYLAFDRVEYARSDRDAEAANLAKNFATAFDQHLNARIGALRMLAASPLADDATRWKDLYQEAKGFHESFGSHVILADLDLRMLLNTRVPFGTALPKLPRAKGRTAAPTALETGEPAVGDIVFGPVAKETLVAIAVPVKRDAKTVMVLLTTFETDQFQKRIDKVALPAGWSLALLDGNGEAIARREPPDRKSATEENAAQRFTARSAVSPWSVVLEIPRALYRAPQIAAGIELALLVLGATLAGILGGMLAGRRLGTAVAALARPRATDAKASGIAEIAEVRRMLDEAAQQRASAEAALSDAHHRLQLVSARLLDVQEAERAAVASELLGEVGQSLAALKLGTQGLARQIQGETELPRLVSLIDDSLARLRRLSSELRPPQLDHLGLTATLQDTLERVAAPAGIETRLVSEPEDIAIEHSLAIAAFRIAQEALANAVRHAAPKRIVVELRATREALELAVSDDGKGFDLEAARARAIKGASVGLLGMEERAALAGGKLKIVTRPGEGTRVQARFSLGSGL